MEKTLKSNVVSKVNKLIDYYCGFMNHVVDPIGRKALLAVRNGIDTILHLDDIDPKK